MNDDPAYVRNNGPGGDPIAQRIEAVPGVVAAAVGFGDEARPRHVWVATSNDRALGDIRRDVLDIIESAGLDVPPDAVSIGPVTPPRARDSLDPGKPFSLPPDDELPAPWNGRFLLLRQLHVRLNDNRVLCQVRLARLGEEFDAEIADVDSELGRARAAARACLLAAQNSAPAVILSLEGLQILSLFGRRYVALSVEAAAQRRLAHLSALVAIEPSVEHAACLAALRATERWLAW